MGLWSRLFKKDRPSTSTTRPRSTYEQDQNNSEKSNPAWSALEERLQIALVPVSRFEKVLRHRSTKESSSIESYETYERYEYLGRRCTRSCGSRDSI
jgi:dsRNA-specific ribonuclease